MKLECNSGQNLSSLLLSKCFLEGIKSMNDIISPRKFILESFVRIKTLPTKKKRKGRESNERRETPTRK
jgi:hypothetical protein